MASDPHRELFRRLYRDRVLAHEVLFRHRHPSRTKDFHRAMIADWHDPDIDRLVNVAFRGCAKSTIAEEAVLLRAGFREFRNALLIGETVDRAEERLHAIRHEIATNDNIRELFGELRGPVDSDGELVLSNGTRILAMGRGQALRGIKFQDIRPDAVFCDDVETKQSVSSPEARKKTRSWFFAELLPACDPKAFVRVAATPLDSDALAVRLTQTPEWVKRVYPIEFINKDGEREATWPERFPLESVDKLRDSFTAQGLSDDFEREYLCEAVSRESRMFREEHIRIVPQVRTWQPVYAMFDPARTTNKNSATTGYACWSWVGSRLIIWDAWGRLLLPDQIVEEVFKCAGDNALPPIWIGVEEDGLNEFLLQPIRQEQVRRGESIPFRAMRAPRGKLDFIRGLQPFFKSGEVEFVKDLPDLKAQLLGFPTGRIDVPNALAYALKLRPGMPIHDSFSQRHVFEELRLVRGAQAYLVLNATRSLITGALCQYREGILYVVADWIREGNPQDLLRDIVAEAQLAAGQRIKLTAAPHHFDHHNNVGLTQAAARLPADVQRSVPPAKGHPALAHFMERDHRGHPAFRISSQARWTLNGLAGGYTRSMKNGVITDTAEDGPYKVLLEGIESFAGLVDAGSLFDDEADMNYATTADGRRYISARG
jgi:hypothetical protein